MTGDAEVGVMPDHAADEPSSEGESSGSRADQVRIDQSDLAPVRSSGAERQQVVVEAFSRSITAKKPAQDERNELQMFRQWQTSADIGRPLCRGVAAILSIHQRVARATPAPFHHHNLASRATPTVTTPPPAARAARLRLAVRACSPA